MLINSAKMQLALVQAFAATLLSLTMPDLEFAAKSYDWALTYFS